MSDHTIRIGVDSRAASRGVKTFTGDLNDSLKALRRFDQTAGKTFAALDKLGKTNLGSLAKQARGTAQALETLNRVKVSKALISNLQSLQQVLRNFRFNVAAIKAVPDALNALNRVRIDSRLPTVINQMKVALTGFRGPPPGAVKNLMTLVQGLAVVNPARIEAAASALAKLNGFKFSAPRGGIGGLGNIARQTSSIRGLQSQIGSLSNSLGHLRTALAGVSATLVARGVYQTGNAFQTLQRTLGTVATSTGEVGDQMKFLTGLTDRMPVSLEAVASSYGRFAIAARLSGITAKETQDTFTGFATAFSAMGVGAEKQSRGFEALIQMMSKGKISSEEIRQQLAEALPGAMQLLADSMNVDMPALSKMLEEGKVLSSELPKMAALLQTRFGPAVEMAMQRASAQLTNLGNEWTTTKRIIFDSGFEAGLGALARSIADALNSDVAKKFAADLGAALGNAATYTAAFIKTVTTNAETLRLAFAALTTLGAIALANALLFVLPPAIGVAVGALKLLGKAIVAAQSRLFLIPAAITLGAVALDQFANGGRATAAILERLGAAAKQIGGGLKGVFADMMGGDLDGLGADFAKNLADAQETAKRIQNSPLFDPNAIQRNGEMAAANDAKKLASLTDQEQELWDQLNPIGKANAEYQKQLVLLDAISSKKGIDTSGYKAALAAQTLDERNPAGAFARDMKADLDSLRAKTGLQRALNDATQTYNELLARGQDVGVSGLAALKDYYVQIARLTGEIGNGIERWTTTVGDFNDQMQNAIKDGIGALSDELAGFLTGAEADFAGLARSILRTFVKISLDSLLKDLFGAMGMDPAKQSASLADQALQRLASIGETITTAQTTVFTSGLSINGVPLGSAPGALPATPGITRAPLAPIPGTTALPNGPSSNDRFPIEPGRSVTFPDGWTIRGAIGANTTAKSDRLGFIDSNINPERFGINPNINPERFGPRANNPFLDLIGRAEGTDKGRGYNESLAYGKFTGGPQNLTGMSLNEIDKLQTQMLQHPANTLNSSALGRYQIVQKTRRGLQAEMGLSGNELFDESMQDKMALRLMERRGNNVAGLRNEWEGLRRVDPATIQSNYAAGTGGVDPMVTNGIDQMKAKLTELGTAAQSAAPQIDTMKAANQNMSNSAMMAGSGVQMAGMNAQGASPQFQQAGSSIQQAGQSAAAGAQAAQTAAPSLDGFGQGISQLLGPLASAIPGLGQFGGMIMQLLQSLFSGGGGLMGGLFAEGGYASQPMARAALPAAAWAGAPHYAEGIANTSGGMPAILHPNEAVIPLSRGREVPVQINDNERGTGPQRIVPNVTNIHFNGIRDADTFRKTKNQTKLEIASAAQRAQMRA